MRIRSIFIILVAAIAAGIAWRVLTREKGAGEGNAGAAGVPVRAAAVTRRDVPIYLTGVGRIQALNTVVVRSQVDGQILSMPFREGADVQAGALLVQIDPRPYQALLDQAEGKLEQDKAQLENARSILKRDSELLGKGMIDQQGFETQKSAVAQLEALAKSDSAAASDAAIKLEFTRITSPIAGRVGLRQADPGNLVHAADTVSLATVSQVQPIALVFVLPERDLGLITGAQGEMGKGKALTVFAVDGENHRTLDTGELLAVDNQIDVNSGTFKLKAVFRNEGRKLWPGQFVNARILVATRIQGLVVPATAVQPGPDGDSVFVIRPDLTVEFRTVRMELSENGVALISAGLAGGERVVIDGQLLLHPRDRVAIKE